MREKRGWPSSTLVFERMNLDSPCNQEHALIQTGQPNGLPLARNRTQRFAFGTIHKSYLSCIAHRTLDKIPSLCILRSRRPRCHSWSSDMRPHTHSCRPPREWSGCTEDQSLRRATAIRYRPRRGGSTSLLHCESKKEDCGDDWERDPPKPSLEVKMHWWPLSSVGNARAQLCYRGNTPRVMRFRLGSHRKHTSP